MIKRIAQPVILVLLKALYGLIKRTTTLDHNKVLFLSRHTNKVPLDFSFVSKVIRRRRPEVKIVVISQVFEGRIGEHVPFTLALLKSLYHLATSKVCVLDSYWPAVSALEHRPELVVYQIWHSLGKVKQTGRQSLDRAQGRASNEINNLRMHEGYDYVIGGAPYWNQFYTEAFAVTEDQILNFGLPRADYLVQRQEYVRKRIRSKYRDLTTKPVILYAPTFRRAKGPTRGAVMLAEAIDTDKYHLIIKPHKDDRLILPKQGARYIDDFTSIDLLTVADYLITDYSSIALEGALLNVPTYYFTYDYDQYMHESGINIDLREEMPGCVFDHAHEVADALDDDYPHGVFKQYQDKFVLQNPGTSTKKIAQHIIDVGGLCPRS